MNRRRLVKARSLGASKDDLRDAKERLKEIEAELRQTELLPETKRGEEREMRYERILRLRAMRDEFLGASPLREERRINSAALALIMTVAAFLLCAFCAAGSFAGLRLLNQKPDPTTTADAFWTQMEQQNYSAAHATNFSSTLRLQLPYDQFARAAQLADAQFGNVTKAVFVKQSGDFNQTGTLTYSVTRGVKIVYTTTLTLTLRLNAWGISDLGATVTPTEAGVKAPTPTPTDTPTAGP